MMRLLIWLGIIYLLYRALRRLVQTGTIPGGSGKFPGTRDVSGDLMVQDPCCGVYFLREDGHHLRHGGKDLYFCSPECREKYMGEHGNTHP